MKHIRKKASIRSLWYEQAILSLSPSSSFFADSMKVTICVLCVCRLTLKYECSRPWSLQLSANRKHSSLTHHLFSWAWCVWHHLCSKFSISCLCCAVCVLRLRLTLTAIRYIKKFHASGFVCGMCMCVYVTELILQGYHRGTRLMANHGWPKGYSRGNQTAKRIIFTQVISKYG